VGYRGPTELGVKEERRLRVFENRALRRIFGFKRDEVTGEWRKLQCVPLANEPGISLIILTQMTILQRNLNRSTFVV